MWGSFPEELLEQFMHDYAERQAMAIGYPQQSFTDKEDLPCNKPKMERHGDKKAVVRACYPGAPEGGKLIRFGDANMTTAGKPKEGESEKMKARRASFKARHRKDIARGPQSGGYWANKFLW
jgi:hypothetical protein